MMLWKDVPERDRVTSSIIEYCGSLLVYRGERNAIGAQEWVNRIAAEWNDRSCAEAVRWTFGVPPEHDPGRALYRPCPSRAYQDGYCRTHLRVHRRVERYEIGAAGMTLSAPDAIAYMEKNYHGRADHNA